MPSLVCEPSLAGAHTAYPGAHTLVPRLSPNPTVTLVVDFFQGVDNLRRPRSPPTTRVRKGTNGRISSYSDSCATSHSRHQRTNTRHRTPFVRCLESTVLSCTPTAPRSSDGSGSVVLSCTSSHSWFSKAYSCGIYSKNE